MKDTLRFKEIPENEKWKVQVIEELTDVKQGILKIDFDGQNISKSEIEDMLHDLTTS